MGEEEEGGTGRGGEGEEGEEGGGDLRRRRRGGGVGREGRRGERLGEVRLLGLHFILFYFAMLGQGDERVLLGY